VLKKPKAGRTLEILTARIESAVSGSGVVIKSPDHLEDKVAGGTREVDVSLRSTVGSAEVLVIVECRDRGRVADVTWIEQIKSKRDAVGASKAIAVSSGTFSKKAIRAANANGIDARTLAQVNSAEVRRWSGSLEIFQQSAALTQTNVTVALAGDEPLSTEVSDRFNQLVKEKSFDAPFIAFIGREGLSSPIDVIKRSLPGGRELPAEKAVKVRIPAKGSFMISSDPVLSLLAGPPPEIGSPVQRQRLIEFPDGEAFFSMEGTYRTLRWVRLDFTVQFDSSIRIESDVYRYSSSKGVIEVAARVADLSGGQLSIVQHREVAEQLEAEPGKRKAAAKPKL
jgi:hypothetical protein